MPAPRADDLVTDPGDQGDGPHAQRDPPQQRWASQKREHDHGNDHDYQHETGPTAEVKPAERLHGTGLQRGIVFIRIDCLVFGAMVREDTGHLGRAADRGQIAHQRRDPQGPLGEVKGVDVSEEAVHQPDQGRGQNEK